ncbi:MAG: hypothetical protein WCJ57_01410 [Candidatus Falkowbacteria bacterium]
METKNSSSQKLILFLLTMMTWLILGSIFHPVQLVIETINNFFPLPEESENYYLAAAIIGLTMIIAIYYFWHRYHKKIFGCLGEC